MLGTYQIHIRGKGRRRVTFLRRRRRVEKRGAYNLEIAAFKAVAPDTNRDGKVIRCRCKPTSLHNNIEMKKCQIHRTLSISYR